MKKELYEQIKQEIIAKGLADNGCVAVGYVYDIGWYTFLGALGGLIVTEQSNCKYIFSKRNDELVIVPYAKKTIVYNEGFIIKKSNILKTKRFGSRVTFKLSDKKKKAYIIEKGLDDMKQILVDLGLAKEKTSK